MKQTKRVRLAGLPVCVWLCVLLLAACASGTSAAGANGGPPAAGATDETAAAAAGEAAQTGGESAANATSGASGTGGAVNGVENNQLRRVGRGWKAVDTLVDGGFFSLGYEVVPQRSTNGEFRYGLRLYYNDLATRQSRPLHVPSSGDGYLFVYPWAEVYVDLFTTGDKLVVCSPRAIETMDLDLTGRKTLYERKDDYHPLYTDGAFLYFEEGRSGERAGRDKKAVCRLDLNTGKCTDLRMDGQKADEPYYVLAGTLGDDLVMQTVEFTPDGARTARARFSALDTATGELRELFVAEANESGLGDSFITGEHIFWRSLDEPDLLHVYSPATGNTTELEFSGKAPYYDVLSVRDGRLIAGGPTEEMGGYDAFSADLATGKTAPLGLRAASPYAEGEELLEIAAEVDGAYLVCTGYAMGDVWTFDGQGKPEQAGAPPEGFAWAAAGDDFARSYAPLYALVEKDDYWAGRVENLPFTLMVA